MDEQFEKTNLNVAEDQAKTPLSPVDLVLNGAKFPLLLEKILNFVIFKKVFRSELVEINLLLIIKDAKSARLVQTSWLKTVSDLLRLCKNHSWAPFHSLVGIPVECEHFVNPASIDTSWTEYYRKTTQPQDDKFKKTLQSFISTMASKDSTLNWKRVPVNMLPFHVTFHATFFASVNHQVILDLLIKCSPGLICLKLELPGNLPGVPSSYPEKIPLPSLKNLVLKFTDIKCAGIMSEKLPRRKREDLQMRFVQCIFNGAEKLLALELGGNYRYSRENPMYMPSPIRDLKLPQSLLILHINLQLCPMNSSDLKNLMSQNRLPVLETFCVTAYAHYFKQRFTDYMEPGLLYEILTPFQWSLKKLFLFGSLGTSDTYRLPKLNNLKSLHVEAMWVMEPMGTDPADVKLRRLDKLLPNVQNLNFKMTKSELMKWTKYPQKYESVQSLALNLLPDEVDEDPEDFESLRVPISLTRAHVESLHSSFPNLTDLGTFVRGPKIDGLRSIFREMTQLKKLFISVQVWYDYPSYHRPLNCIYWDALFLGCTVEIADMLRKDGQQKQGEKMLKALQRKDHKGKFPSILKLKNLEQLCLETSRDLVFHRQPEVATGDSEFPEWNLYDTSFHRAFFKMEKLTSMQIHAKANVSASVFNEWKRLKGTDLKVEGGHLFFRAE